MATPSRRLVIPAHAGIRDYCVLQRPALEVDHISLEMRVIRGEAVIAVTNGRLDGSTELAEVFGTWEPTF